MLSQITNCKASMMDVTQSYFDQLMKVLWLIGQGAIITFTLSMSINNTAKLYKDEVINPEKEIGKFLYPALAIFVLITPTAFSIAAGIFTIQGLLINLPLVPFAIALAFSMGELRSIEKKPPSKIEQTWLQISPIWRLRISLLFCCFGLISYFWNMAQVAAHIK
jgi:hypothetical protein